MDTTITPLIERLGDMDFAHRLATTRRSRSLTQQALADTVGIHVTQIRRYEAGTSQPTLDVLRALAIALSVTTDALVFTDTERGPTDTDLRLHLEALNQLDDDEKATVINLIESILLRHQARRLARSS
jgi:transcriptional regulator with XRE-family HTH domain